MWRRLILHPILIAAFPVLFLFDKNIRDYPIDVVYAPLVAVIASAVAMWAVLRWLMGDWRRSGLLISLAFLLFFSYGQFARLLPRTVFSASGVAIGTRLLLAGASLVVFAAALLVVVRTRADLAKVTMIANVVAVGLMFIPCFEIPKFYIQNRSGPGYSLTALNEGTAERPTRRPDKLPNIYYIILDGYSRADNLKELYGYDNAPFIDYLKAKGFFVASQARSNYAHTQLSLASSLNMAQLTDLAAAVGRDYIRAKPLYKMIRHSRVQSFVKALGYRFVAFSSGYDMTEISSADEYLLAPQQRSEFVDGLLSLTPVESDESRGAAHRRRVLYAFDKMPELARSAQPCFVFAHILGPHPPFVFGPDGGPVDVGRYYGIETGSKIIRPGGLTRKEAMRAYIDQVIFINSKVETLVDRLTSESAVPPIILLQGDHGGDSFLNRADPNDTYMQDRMCILSAYYLPGASQALYDTITPVNSFRVVFNQYFGTSLPMLPDRSYFSNFAKTYDFFDVTDRIGSPEDRKVYERLKSQDYFDTPSGTDAFGNAAEDAVTD